MNKAVYALRHPHGFYKIGTSVQPYERYQSVQTATPYQIEMYAILETPHEDATTESEFHDTLDVYHRRGEWFNVPVAVLDNLLDAYARRDGFSLSRPQLNGDADGDSGFSTPSL
jgi:hypothetical protein